MRLRLLPDGRPGEHLGLSHTLKHYLKPNEMWADLCEDIEPHLRPLGACERLPALDPPTWEQWQDPPPPLAGAWDQLRPVYRQGYGRLVLELADPLDDPGVGEGWVPRKRGFACHAGDGVILEVAAGQEDWRLHSAWRPMDFKLRRHECPPTDARSVSIRRKIAEHAAARRVAAWRDQEDDR
ncbi:MAG: hypothetical protein ABIO70_28970 [Pseudomonadota bacterium]